MAHAHRVSWFLFTSLLLLVPSLGVLVPAVVATESAHAQTLSVLYSFTGRRDGVSPAAALIRDAAGNLYGTTSLGGDVNCNNGYGCGTVFKIDPAGKKMVLHRFKGGTDGAIPLAGLLRDRKGNLYGTTQSGGDPTCNSPTGCGTVFKLDATGKETVLYSFKGGTDGAGPHASLVQDTAGNLYGTTVDGGAFGWGTVFKLDKSGVEAVLHNFGVGADGQDPIGGLVPDAAGNLYGTTAFGGAFLNGTVFKLDKGGSYTVLYSFGDGADGAAPYAGLVRDKAGNLYGTTYLGGGYGWGTVFKLDTSGHESVGHSFALVADGELPFAALVRDAAGNLYGTTTQGGGTSNYGTVFKLDKDGKETVLHSFTGGADGAWPYAGLIRDKAGNLYGTTAGGGTGSCDAGCGTVFKLTP
jgi:uncharacterized repeat protein (TIGR03803 family)